MLTKQQQSEVRKAVEAQARKVRVAKMTANILSAYARSTDEEREHGMRWYSVARALIADIASKYGIDARLAITVCAVTSPKNTWTGNLRDTDLILRTFATKRKAFDRMVKAFDTVEGKFTPRGDKDAFKSLGAQTYPACILKAYRILRDKSRHHLTEDTAPKTFSFDENIADDNSARITVDFHAYNIAMKTDFKSGEVNITKRPYAEISEAYRNAARAVGIEPRQIQAVVWVNRRNGLDRANIAQADRIPLKKAAVMRLERERRLFAL